ncbi:MAG: hypothetical protein KDK08_23180 [Rhizobiaceae bacterium]|nr:hypothetical protein [Rhizobiaceae bacterium]
MNLGKYAASMAELFIVLIVMFLIQALLNFSLSESVESSKRADLISLSIRQVPSGSDESDHLVYISIFEGHYWITKALIGVPERRELRSFINLAGQCAPYPQLNLPDANDRFAERVEQVGLNYTTVALEGMQTVHVFTWDPKAIDDKVSIKIGFHDCQLPSSPKSLAVRDQWNLDITKSEFPHPLVVTIDRYTEHISTTNKLYYHHIDRFLPTPFSINNDPSLFGLSFTTTNCSVDGNTRRQMVREVSFSLKDLP